MSEEQAAKPEEKQSNLERKKFKEIFDENENEVLCLKVRLKIAGQTFAQGTFLKKEERLGGIDFHKLRYLDIAVASLDNNTSYELKGFFPQK